MHPLHQTINSLAHLSDQHFEQLLAKTTASVHPAHSEVLRSGQFCRGVYYVTRGLLGVYRLVDGREAYQEFGREGYFVTDMVGLTTQRAAIVTIKALEETETLFIPRNDLLDMYALSERFQTFGRLLLESLVARTTERATQLATLTAPERYTLLLEREPELLARVPLQYLSSYLGMTRETLSRVRRRKKK